MFHDAYFIESLLEYFEIVDELVFELCFPIDFAHRNFSRVEDVCKLAIESSWTQLFYFGEVGLEEIIDPVEQFSSRHLDRVVEVDADLVYHLLTVMKF